MSLLNAQGISINTSGSAADPSAILDVNSANLGILIPRVALTDTNDAITITSPASSMLVFNTNNTANLVSGYYYNEGTPVSPHWVELLPNPTNQNLNTAGNKIVNLATCTDGHDAANKDYVDAMVAGGGGSGGGGCAITTGATELSHITTQKFSFPQACNYCDTLTEDGHTDWYIPSFEEVLFLMSTSWGTITDKSSALAFWTNTTDQYYRAYMITFCFGCPGQSTANMSETGWVYARCARK